MGGGGGGGGRGAAAAKMTFLSSFFSFSQKVWKYHTSHIKAKPNSSSSFKHILIPCLRHMTLNV